MPAGDIHLETEFEKYVARKLTNLTQLDGVKWVKSDNGKRHNCRIFSLI